MSRAFIREDTEIPDRTFRTRSASGLPPGAVNYMTPEGAAELSFRLARLKKGPGRDENQIQNLEEVLKSAKIVSVPAGDGDVRFGSVVILENAQGELASYRIAGADEVSLDPRNVSWVSPLGKELLSGRVRGCVKLPPGGEEWRIIRIE